MFYELQTFHTDFQWTAGSKHMLQLQLPFDATAASTALKIGMKQHDGAGTFSMVDQANVSIGAYAAGVTPVTLTLPPTLTNALVGVYDYTIMLVPAGVAADAFAVCAGQITWVANAVTA